jgi:triosephosphate isomerase
MNQSSWPGLLENSVLGFYKEWGYCKTPPVLCGLGYINQVFVSMMKPTLIIGNWKMHGSRASISQLLQELKALYVQLLSIEVEWAICPPFLFLEQCEAVLWDTPISLGAQDVCEQAGPGAYTGEVSAEMLREFSCRYVLVGHSERRRLYGETNSVVAAKFRRVLEAQMSPVLCVGETLEERKAGKTLAVIKEQLAAVLEMPDNCALPKDGVVAYEPVWAIGTGCQASPEQAQEVHATIREQIAVKDPLWASSLRILYGGSVTADNAKDLLTMKDVHGALVGGASLNAKKFLEIGMQCKRSF